MQFETRRPESAAIVPGAVVIHAADLRLQDRMPAAGIAVPVLPYLVGRLAAPDEDVSRQPVGLFLPDRRPYRLSRRHFAIIRREGRFWILDGASRLGTVVNGQSIGRKCGRDAIPLQAGDNAIVAGGTGSEYAFRIVVRVSHEPRIEAVTKLE